MFKSHPMSMLIHQSVNYRNLGASIFQQVLDESIKSMESKQKSFDELLESYMEINLMPWDDFYDKYLSVMHGIIRNLVEDKTLAEEIFKKAFSMFRENKILSQERHGIWPSLIRSTYNLAMHHLKILGVKPRKIRDKETVNVVMLLCVQCNSIEHAANVLQITEKEARQKMNLEISDFRKKNSDKESVNSNG